MKKEEFIDYLKNLYLEAYECEIYEYEFSFEGNNYGFEANFLIQELVYYINKNFLDKEERINLKEIKKQVKKNCKL